MGICLSKNRCKCNDNPCICCKICEKITCKYCICKNCICDKCCPYCCKCEVCECYKNCSERNLLKIE